MTGKSSFILYTDLIHTVNKLSDQKAGQLFKLILGYVNDENPVAQDALVEIAFEPIKQRLKKDLQKWEEIREKRSIAGLASANKRQQVSTHVKSVKQNEHMSTVSVSDNVSVNVNEKNKIHIPEFNEFISYAKTLSIYHESMNFQIEAKYTSWKENKWKDGNNKKIGNWKTKLRNTMPYFKRDFTAGSMKSKFTYEELLQETAKFSPDQRKSHFEKFELFEEHGKKYYRRKNDQ